MQEFNSLFPNFLDRCLELKSALMPVAYVLLIVGMISSTITGHRSPSAYLRTFGRTIVYIMLLVYLPVWGNLISHYTDVTVREVLKADPAGVFEAYNDALVARQSATEERSWYDKLFNASTTFFEAIVSGLLLIFGLLASAIMFYAYLAQKMILFLGYSLAPIFVGFLAVRSLSEAGRQYFLRLLGVMLWPLGWGVAAIVTDGLLDFMTDRSFLHDRSPDGLTQYGFQNFVGIALLGVWLMFSTIAAPVIMQKVLLHGYQAGSMLLSGTASAASGGVTTGASTMAALGYRQGSPVATAGLAAVAGAAAASAAVAGAAAETGYGGSLFNSLANLNERRSARGDKAHDSASFGEDDLTGSKAAREMLEKTQRSSG